MSTKPETKSIGPLERERIAALFAQSPISMAILIGTTHIFEFANPSYCDLVGRDDLMGKTVKDALPEISSQGFIDLLNRVYSRGERFEARGMAVHLKKQSGPGLVEVFLDFTYDPLKEADGKIIGIMVIAVDVTLQVRARLEIESAKNALEVEKKNFQRLFHETHEIVAFMRGPEHRFEFVNPAHIQLLGKNVTGLTVREAQPEAAAVYKILDRVFQTGETAQFREHPVMIGQSQHFFDFIYAARRDAAGNVDGIMALVSDVTERILVRQRLEQEKQLETRHRQLMEEQQTWLETILNRLPFIVLLIEPVTGKALFANNAAKWLYGPNVVESNRASRFSKIKSISDAEGKKLRWHEVPSARAARGERVRDLEVIVTTDEGVFNLIANSEFLPAAGSREASILVFAQDISETRKAEREKREASQQTEAERRKLHDIFEQAPVGITIVRGPDHVYELVNDNYRKMMPDKREYLGRKYIEVFPEIQDQGIVEILNHAYQTGDPYRGTAIPVKVRDADGTLRQKYYDFLLQPLFVTDKQIDGLVTIVLDVTPQVSARTSMLIQQRKVLESELRFRKLADTMPQIVWTARPDGVLNYTNARWVTYSGSSEPEAWLDFVHPNDKQKVIESWTESVTTGKSYAAEFRLRRKSDATYRWHLVRAVQIFDDKGKVVDWFGTCTDIQEQKEAQAEIIVAKANAEAANSAKTAFLANMSHEIRTPLGAILGFTDLLQKASLNTDEKKYLDVIVRNGQILTTVIDDILDISKIEAGKMDIEIIPFSPHRVLREVAELFSDKINSKNVKLELNIDSQVPDELISDPSRLRQILVNIVGNAVKFTNNGQIQVSATCEDVSDSEVRLSVRVRDTGVGLDPVQAQNLFQPFTQAESGTNRKFGGTGLGLAISRKLAQALGGQLQLLECAPGAGCTFEIEIRARKPEKKNNPANPIITSDHKPAIKRLTGLRILGVDDSADNRVLLGLFLKREGADFYEADSGETALKKIKAASFDIVLMDIQMPGIDGYETVRILREGGYQKPIIALTAHAMSEERRKTLDSGFDDHVTKPISPPLLVEAILRALPKS